MAPRFRTWTWTRIDGRNVIAIPTRDEVHIYDSEDFILLDKIAPSGHRTYIHAVRWSAFHGKLLSLSANQLIVHVPQLVVENDRSSGSEGEQVKFVRICDYTIDGSLAGLRSVAFSRCADLLLVGGEAGIGIIDIRASSQLQKAEDLRLSSIGDADKKMVWFDPSSKADVVKFSPCSFVFAAFSRGETSIRVWRTVRDPTATGDLARRVIQVHSLDHPEPVAYASWKPAASQMHTAVEYDGVQKARWFEPQRMLLTCTIASRTIRIWIEDEALDGSGVTFVPALAFDPSSQLHNLRWVLSKNRNISEEKFQITDATDAHQMNWISGVDPTGVLHLYQVVGAASKSPVVLDTELRIAVNGEEGTGASDQQEVPTAAKLVELEEICVMAYFSQNYFGLPSKLDVVLQRSDGILLSYIIAVNKTKHVHIKKKNWYRSHLGSIAALASHPSLPLVASVDQHRRDPNNPLSGYSNEILIFWISFSAFSAESRLIPSGVLECPPDSGPVLCLQWIPTLHFDATPLFLVAYASGAIDIYGRAANAADVVSSPRSNKHQVSSHPHRLERRTRSPSLSPWTFFDYTTGQSGVEYEVALQRDETTRDLGFQVESSRGVLRVSKVTSPHQQVSVGDELLSFNSHNLLTQSLENYQQLVDELPAGAIALLRLRSLARGDSSRSSPQPPAISEDSVEDGDLPEDEAAARSLRRNFLASAESDFTLNASYVHAGSVSMYGGWRQLLTAKVAPRLRLVCVSPVYADDGEYIPGTVLIFGVAESLPGTLSAWKGVYSAHTYTLHPLHINDGAVLKKQDVTSLAGERDYRQRAFRSSQKASDSARSAIESVNSLVFVGDATGSVHHWRCRVVGSSISFTMMSTYSLSTVSTPAGGLQFDSDSFFRRGYFNARFGHGSDPLPTGIGHIEVDDPNRLAVLHTSQPDAVHVFEGESGLGIMRLEETIRANGRGRVLGFCWCNAHVEFNIDALAVHYESAIVIYQYDMVCHRWTQVGNDIATALAAFDCTRDSSALLIGGGHSTTRGEETEEIPIVLGKWDEPGKLLQHAMDWKAPESPQKLPVWHPHVVITTLFGMHARVGYKDTTMASDSPTFEFSKAFKDAVQMLKLLAKVLDDDASTRLSASSGVLAYSVPQNSRVGSSSIVFMSHVGRRDSIGRYSTAVHVDNSHNKAENLFAEPPSRRSFTGNTASQLERLDQAETSVLTSAIDAVLQPSRSAASARSNGSILFGSFDKEHLVALKAILLFVHAVQSLSFDLDASAADLGAKRYYAMFLFARSLRSALDDPVVRCSERKPSEDLEEDEIEKNSMGAFLNEPPSSGVLWALHSSAQTFLIEHCIPPQANWTDLRPLWIALWVRDVKDLRAIVERLAKITYTRTRDAMDVALYYIALGKKNVLGALAKVSKKDSNRNLAIFLENDFTQERWSTAAIKNAYSLLSKKQYEAAAAFFLLCEPPRLQEALRLLATRLQDPGLALLVARLVEYRLSDAFAHDFIASTAAAAVSKEMTPLDETASRLLEHDLIPLFRTRGDRWLESVALWWLEDFEQACTILTPQAQPIEIDLDAGVDRNRPFEIYRGQRSQGGVDAVRKVRSTTYFYVNLTSIPLYFQFLHASGVDAPLVSKAIQKLLLSSSASSTASQGRAAAVAIAARKHTLASTADIEHAFSFAAYVCKRSGMSDTSLVEMLQARHLVNLHAKVELQQASGSDALDLDPLDLALPTSPRMAALSDKARAPSSSGIAPLSRQSSFNSDTRRSPRWLPSPRRMSELHDAMESGSASSVVQGVKTLLQRSNTVANWSLSSAASASTSTAGTSSSAPSASTATPWLKAQIADIDCRRWSSSAFVGKMLGIRVAREMITHFRGELDTCFRHHVDGMPLRAERHRDFLEELCAPLCEQFLVDRTYVLEAALAVLQPHAYLHVAEICFLLAVLGRSATLTKWIQYVALSMLGSCGTFASCRITQAIYRDWESLTVQLAYVLHLDAQGQIDLPPHVVAHVAVAVRTGVVFLSWCKREWAIVHEAINRPFYSKVGEPKAGEDPAVFFAELSRYSFQQNVELLRSLQRVKHRGGETEFTSSSGSFGYLFLRTVAAHLHGDEHSFGDASSQPESEHSTGSAAADASLPHAEPKLHKMYRLILMVSILRTLYARAQVFLLGCHGAASGSAAQDAADELDLSSSLFTPRKLWKPLIESPLDGIRRWYSLIESHLRCEFDYSVKEDTCICGLYGLDGRSADLAARVQERVARLVASLEHQAALPTTGQAHSHHHHHLRLGFHHHVHHDSAAVEPQHCHYRLDEILEAVGIAPPLHEALVQASDDYVLLLMRHPKYGVPLSVRRFRLEPRVFVKCFLLEDAFDWCLSTARIFQSDLEVHNFLSRCCTQRKLRLLVKRRGQDPHHFPIHLPRHHHKDDCLEGDAGDQAATDQPPTPADDHTDEAMVFVDPWEIEAQRNAELYLHNQHPPRHSELGCDRLSTIYTAMPDDLAKAAFHGDADLCEMWQSTCGEGWLITSIIQYQLDGVHSHRQGRVEATCVFEEDDKVPYLVEVHSRSQRNALFQEVGLPHRFMGVITVKLLAGQQLIPVKWIEYFSDPYVFLAVSPNEDAMPLESDSWTLQTYRSRCAPGGTNPVWSHTGEDEFAFRFAIPTHSPHFAAAATTGKQAQGDDAFAAAAERVWSSASTTRSPRDATTLEALESLFQHGFTGPPLFLHCAVYHKTKVFAHHFMGRGKVALTPLTSGNPMDVWIPLQGVDSGSLHVQISLSFQLLRSSAGSAHSASSYHEQDTYESSDQQQATTTGVDPAVLGHLPPLPPHLTPRAPRSKESTT